MVCRDRALPWLPATRSQWRVRPRQLFLALLEMTGALDPSPCVSFLHVQFTSLMHRMQSEDYHYILFFCEHRRVHFEDVNGVIRLLTRSHGKRNMSHMRLLVWCSRALYRGLLQAGGHSEIINYRKDTEQLSSCLEQDVLCIPVLVGWLLQHHR